MKYELIRHIHGGLAGMSILLFALRGALQLRGVNWRRWRVLRIWPHLNDTGLLIAALTLVTLSGRYPFIESWLTAKVLALCLYIILGSLALRSQTPERLRPLFYALALLTVGYIVAVAKTHSPVLGLF